MSLTLPLRLILLTKYCRGSVVSSLDVHAPVWRISGGLGYISCHRGMSGKRNYCTENAII